MDRKHLDALAGLPEDLRLLLNAGLETMANEMTEKHPLLKTIELVRHSLVTGTVVADAPQHVRFDAADLHEMVSYMKDSQYWTVYWEPARLGRYDLVGEIGSGNGEVLQFELASELRGSERFVLAPADMALAERVRSYLRIWQPPTTDELHVATIEIPVAWDAHEPMMRNSETLEAYVGTIAASEGLSGTMVRGAYCDVHSTEALATAGYSGITTLAIDVPRNIEALPRVIANYEASLAAPYIRRQ